MTKKALGRGLDALISGGGGGSAGGGPPPGGGAISPPPPNVVQPLGSRPANTVSDTDANMVRHLVIDTIERSRFQPRTDFDPEQLRELADSIKQRGVIQPLLVRPFKATDGTARYELIAGERRGRAAREAGLTTIPAIVREANDQEVLEIALIENLQREDLNAVEEARAYEQLSTQFKLTPEQNAEKVGRSRAAVANSMRLLGLPGE